MNATLTTTEGWVRILRAAGFKVTAIRPGVVASVYNGRYYRHEQTSQGWRTHDAGPALTR